MKSATKNKIIIVDDSKLYQSTLADVLRTGMQIDVRFAINATEMFKVMNSFEPDLIIYDLFSASDNFELTMREIRLQSQNAKVVILSYEINSEIVDYCETCGAAGFLYKGSTDIVSLISAVEQIKLGVFVSPLLQAALKN